MAKRSLAPLLTVCSKAFNSLRYRLSPSRPRERSPSRFALDLHSSFLKCQPADLTHSLHVNFRHPCASPSVLDKRERLTDLSAQVEHSMRLFLMGLLAHIPVAHRKQH